MNHLDYEDYRELDERHSWGIGYHWLGHRLIWRAAHSRIEKHQWRRRYYDQHALTRPPRAVHREECWVCGNLYAETSLESCQMCDTLLCRSCAKDQHGLCTFTHFSIHEYRRSQDL